MSYEYLVNCDVIVREMNNWFKPSKLYGNGWYCSKIRAYVPAVMTDTITVEVTVYITDDDDAEDDEINRYVQCYVSDRLEDVEMFKPGLLAETDPPIEIIITKKE